MKDLVKNYSFRADQELTDKIERYVDKEKVSYASLFKTAVNTYINQQKALDELPQKSKEAIDIIRKMEKMLGQAKNQYGLDEIEK